MWHLTKFHSRTANLILKAKAETACGGLTKINRPFHREGKAEPACGGKFHSRTAKLILKAKAEPACGGLSKTKRPFHREGKAEPACVGKFHSRTAKLIVKARLNAPVAPCGTQ
jgi:hypothetical protein